MRFWLLLVLMLAQPAWSGPADLRDFDARTWSELRARQAGKPFILALWSIHCEPCARDMPVWKSLTARHPDVDVILVATDPPSEHARVREFLRRFDPGRARRYAFADDMEERVRFAIDPRWRGELPRTYLIAGDGTMEGLSGAVDAARMDRWARGRD